MSTYDDYDQPRRYHSTRTRYRDREEPDFVREETFIERGKGAGPRDLVFRGRDDSIEDIPREFPPPAARDYRRSREYDEYSAAPRRARSVASRRDRDYDDYYDDRYTDYAAPAAAGAAGYAAGRRRDRSRRRDDRDYDSEYSRSPPRRPKHERKKSGVEDVLGGLGLGAVAAALTGKGGDKSRDRSSVRSRSTRRGGRRGSSSSSRSRSRGGPKKGQTERQWAQAAQAAVIAGAVEAFRSRKEPGPWTGERGKRIATAAIGAGGIDKFLDRNPDEKSKRHLAEAVVGGLAANRLANGARSKSRGRGADSRAGSPDSFATGRSGLRARSRSVIDRLRGRSQSRGRAGSPDGGGHGGLKGLVAGGALAAAGKTIYDRVRSKSRKRRSPSNSSADSYVPSRTRRRDRRRSPRSDTGTTRRSRVADDRRREIRDTRDTNNEYTAHGGALTRGAAAGAGAGALTTGGNGGNVGKNQTGKEDELSDSSSTTDMENKRKRMRGKEFLTAGLASIATIHAAHGIYSSMEAHEKRHRLVAEGEMTPEEARKKQTKAWVQDAAAVGIAALGIKGAFSEWKGMNEQRCVSLCLILKESIS